MNKAIDDSQLAWAREYCIRVPQDIDHEAVYKELLKWTPDAKPPKAVLSLTGGSTHFLNNETLVSRLKSGLLNLITTTSLWIFTGGTNYGITTSVGEAVREYKEKNDKNDHIMAFGFLPWVENLKNIEPNHTHFVMVDGSKDKASELRTKLRSYFKSKIDTFSINWHIYYTVT
ncbi:transient receptor potential cation channel subfamily M member 8-like [Mytilus trossulus]|uniref:transient receptor potential cation channel subfamily M member 8-like n=1 Tax=Mytilus trossulus TaxID=6551 RepID=UPI0030063092